MIGALRVKVVLLFRVGLKPTSSATETSFNFREYGLLIFQNQLFRKILSGTPSGCQTVWIRSGPDLYPNCLQNLTADDKSRGWPERVNIMSFFAKKEKCCGPDDSLL